MCPFCEGFWIWDEPCFCSRTAPEGWEPALPDVCGVCDMPEDKCCCG